MEPIMNLRRLFPRKHSARRRPGTRSRESANQPRVERLEDRWMPSVDLTGVGIWESRGPGPIQDSSLAPNVNVGGTRLDNPAVGAVQVLAPHPTNKNILYAGTANGGIWKTTDAYDRDPVWTPLTDQFPSLSISALAFSPMDATHNTLFAGIGAMSNSRVDGPRSSPAILRTTDGGITWTQLGGNMFTNLTIASIVPTKQGSDAAHQVILVAAYDQPSGTFPPQNTSGSAGIYRSADGGATFQLIKTSSDPLLPGGAATELIADPGNPHLFYAGITQAPNGLQGVLESIDDGNHWFAENNGITGVADASRIRLAITNHPGANGIDAAFAAVVDQSGKLSGVFESTKRGQVWVAMGASGFGDPNPPNISDAADHQGAINLSLTVNPKDPNDVYIGGDEQDDLGAHISFIDRFQPTLQRTPLGIFLTPGWHGVTGLFDRPHPDSRNMVFDAAGQLLECDDGGIYRRVDHDHWDAVTGSLANTEIYSVGYDALNDKLFAGAQDNGLSEEGSPTFGMQIWNNWEGGDGQSVGIGYTTVDNQPASIRYGMGNNLVNGGLLYKVYTAGNHEEEDHHAILGDGAPHPNPPGPFLTGLDPVDRNPSQGGSPHQFPLAVNPFDGNRIVFGGHSLYESTNRGNTLKFLLVGKGGGLSNTSAVVYGGRLDGDEKPDVVVASVANMMLPGAVGSPSDTSFHLFFRASAGESMQQVANDPPLSRSAISIVADPDDWRKVYVTDGTNIFYSPDITAGDSSSAVIWLPVAVPTTGNALQIGNIHCLEVVSPTPLPDQKPQPGDEALLIGADGGVFKTLNPHDPTNTPVWTEVGAGLPNAPVFDLHYIPPDTLQVQVPTDDVLVAGTLGRGAWVLRGADSVIAQTQSVLTINGNPILGQDNRFRINTSILGADLQGANVFPHPIFNVFDDTIRPAPVSGTPTAQVARAAVDKIALIGGNEKDVLTVEFTDGQPRLPQGGLNFSGGGGTNRLILTGGVPPATYMPAADGSPANGKIQFANSDNLIDFTNMAVVTGVAPVINSVHLSATTVTRGDMVAVTGSFSAPGNLTQFTVLVKWAGRTPFGESPPPGSTTTVHLLPGARFFHVAHPAVGTGDREIVVSIIAGDGLSDSALLPITVVGNPVTAKRVNSISVQGATDFVPVASFVDPAGPDVVGTKPLRFNYTATISWGDDSSPTSSRISPRTVPANFDFGKPPATPMIFDVLGSHLYTKTGTFTATVTIHHAGADTTVTSTVTVRNVANHPNAHTGPLVIGASIAGDAINVMPVGTQTRSTADVVEVFVNNTNQGRFTGFTTIELYGQDGSDDLEINPGILKNAVLIGRGGDDILRGGGGNDSLSGGEGNDVLDGGAGVNTLDAGPGQDGVVIRGTNRDDHIAIDWQLGANGAQIVAYMNGHTSIEDYLQGETVFVFAGKGNDVVQMLPGATAHWRAELHGEDGNDVLFGGNRDDLLDGGSGNDVLVGGAGNSEIDGGDGRNLLISGRGAATLVGGSNDDLLIAGSTAFDRNVNALSAIMAEWSSKRSYEDRVANLRGAGPSPRANGNYFLTTGTSHSTVLGAGGNSLTGDAGRDWFFALLGDDDADQITDLAANELVDPLSPPPLGE
jgi:Ca2+-binding RTX toxin-like protein